MRHQPLYPAHRVFSKNEGSVEHKIQQGDEDRECQPPVGYKGIYLICYSLTLPLSLIWDICLGERSLHECIFGIHKRGLQS